MEPISTVDEEWEKFMDADDAEEEDYLDTNSTISDALNDVEKSGDTVPTPSDLYISTKSKIAYLNNAENLDLMKIFWGIPIIPYAQATNGVIKKQTKFNSTTPEELNYIQDMAKSYLYVNQLVITSISNPTGRIKFKDSRKVSIGISKKDLLSYRCKEKGAFYNCVVLILRLKVEETFNEYHIKIFNTGKVEIPGIPNDDIFDIVKQNVLEILAPFVPHPLDYTAVSIMVLINSNFNCGFFINREALFDILKYKYNIQCMFDPCSYPGIQCKFYYNSERSFQSGSKISEEQEGTTEVSFMIFRTGSGLIVGMCEEYILHIIYEFIKRVLLEEYDKISLKNVVPTGAKTKTKKPRRKIITVIP